MVSISGWTEAIIFSLLFVSIFAVVISSFNLLYDKDYSLPFDDNSGAEQLFIDYQDTAQSQIEGGEVEFDASQGITLKSSWGLAKDAVSVAWSFLSGGWIEQIIDSWNFGEGGALLAKGIRIIYFLSLVFAILYALFKVTV